MAKIFSPYYEIIEGRVTYNKKTGAFDVINHGAALADAQNVMQQSRQIASPYPELTRYTLKNGDKIIIGRPNKTLGMDISEKQMLTCGIFPESIVEKYALCAGEVTLDKSRKSGLKNRTITLTKGQGTEAQLTARKLNLIINRKAPVLIVAKKDGPKNAL